VHSFILVVVAGLSFTEALERVDAAPDVAGSLAAAEARRTSVSTLPALSSNPTLTLQPGFRTNPTEPLPEGLVSVAQSFNLAGLTQARRSVASAEAGFSRATALERRWQRRVEVGRRWAEAWAAHRAHSLAAAEAEAGRALVAKLARASEQQAVTRAELETAKAFAAEAEAAALGFEGAAFDAEAALAEALGLEQLEAVTGELPGLTPPGASTGPSVHERVAQAQLEVAQARDLEVRAQWGTSLTATLIGAREVPSQWVGALGLGVTLPVFERGQAEVAAQHSLSTRLDGEREAARRRARIEQRVLEHELEHTAEVLAVVDGHQRPAATEAARLETLRFEHGETTLAELLVVRRQALAAQVAALSARAEVVMAQFKALEWRQITEQLQ
jgi:outer membrane protein TolC